MAMLPFCGYNMADYFRHWVAMGTAVPRPPRIFHVNWFRQSADGKFLWPGFGDNVRVLRWIVDRCQGKGEVVESPIGLLPERGALDTGGLQVDDATMRELLSVARDDWRAEAEGIGAFFAKFDGRLSDEMARQRARLVERLG
jgi:phosphoenolpyruvate carboxykinase (GTP)